MILVREICSVDGSFPRRSPILMAVAIALAIWFLWWVVDFDQPWGPLMFHVVFPAAMWLVAGYFSVVRFLSYLDLRIRREGWEVELIVLAAARQLEDAVIDVR